jgi:hypothetical protein
MTTATSNPVGALVKYTQDALTALLTEHASALEAARSSASVVTMDDFKVESIDDERAVADHLNQIAAGLKAITTIKRAGSAEAKRAVEIVRDACAFVEGPLNEADAKCRRLTLEFRGRERERARKEQEQAQISAAQAAHEAAQVAIATNVPPPPPVDIPQEMRSNVTLGGAGAAIHSTKRLRAMLVDARACDPTWLLLADSSAIAWAQDQVRQGRMRTPGIGPQEGVEEHGVRFYYEEILSRSGGVRR